MGRSFATALSSLWDRAASRLAGSRINRSATAPPFKEPRVASPAFGESSGWNLVMCPLRGIHPDLSWQKQYEMGRAEWDVTHITSLSNFHPAANIAGLYWRELPGGYPYRGKE